MIRLIDADKLKEYIVQNYGICDNLQIIDAIDKQPTAFDVDKVIKQLRDEGDRSYTNFETYANDVCITEDDDWHFMGLKRAIEILWKGGEVSKC